MAKISDVVDNTDLEQNTHEAQPDHGSIVNDAMNDATLDASLQELAGKDGDLDISDLRDALGDEALGLDDTELLKMWNDAKAGVEKPEGDEAAAPAELPFPLYDAKGNKVTDVSKVTLQDFFDGKYQVAYQAMGKEQRKAYKDLVRNASLGHYNESKMSTLTSERQRAMEMLSDLRKEHEAWGTDRKTWDRVLNAYVQGNPKPLEQLLTTYVTELGKAPAQLPQGSVSQDAMELERQGTQVFTEYVVPQAWTIANEYGANPQEVINAAKQLINQEPAEFFTKEKLDNILNHEIRVMLEDAGYTANGKGVAPINSQPDPRDKQIEELRNSIAEIKASQANNSTQRARAKVRTAPSAGGGSVSGAGESMPNMKNRADMKKFLRGETE